MGRMGWAQMALLLLLVRATIGQPARTFILGGEGETWESGGRGIDPVVIVNAGQGTVDTTNAPDDAIDFSHRSGWISPLRFDEEENIASRVLAAGSITAPNAGRGYEEQLKGVVNGDHLIAFERKPTLFDPRVLTRGILVILDFAVPVGVQRVRFYPRNTVFETPSAPFQNDFLRGYEVWLNATETSPSSPDVLIARETENERAVVDLSVPSQYARYVRIKSLADVPFEIDEIEVYGTGYLQKGTYLSDLIDLGDRATVGPIRWEEEAVAEAAFSQLSVRMRTGHDDSPIRYRRFVRDMQGNVVEAIEVPADEYFLLERVDRARLVEDVENWSPWKSVRNGELSGAPGPRRFVQFQLDFEGDLFATRQAGQLEFDYLQPPIADMLTAEIFPRLAQAEEPATFRYAVRLRRAGEIRGFDRLEVDTNVAVGNIREVKLDGEPLEFAVEFIRPEMFSISFPAIDRDDALLEFTFDLPIFRFGSTFSGRAYHSGSRPVPQALSPGNAIVFEPGDIDELSDLSVAIPRPQIGKLVGEIAIRSPVITPNGDGINDSFEVFFNVLQLTQETPVRFELYDLSGRRVEVLFAETWGIGPVEFSWDGLLDDGGLILPGIYAWALRVEADAFEEVHTGTMGVVY